MFKILSSSGVANFALAVMKLAYKPMPKEV